MADLKRLFQDAETELGLQRERPKKGTMEVLKFKKRGVAWRWLGKNTIQLCPPTKRRKMFRDGQFFVIQDNNSECRYNDPSNMLSEIWSYSGCDCTDLTDGQVWEWIKTAYKYRKD